MNTPSILLGLIISSLYGALFHLWRNGGGGRLILYLLLSWLGFWTGQFLGNLLNITFGSIGPLRLGMATIFSILSLGIGYWLSLIESSQQ
jgi:hypothetical protein